MTQQKPKIKICGITSLDDARMAARTSADYLGFIIDYPASPRSITPETAGVIIENVKNEFPTVRCVVVFVDKDFKTVKNMIGSMRADIVQLHGSESPAYCGVLRETIEVWKVLIVKTDADLEHLDEYRASADKVMFDAGRGSGQVVDTKLLAGIKVDILAGGLNATNVQQAIAATHPLVVDFNSGVESMSGKKDPEKIRAAIAAVRNN